MARSKTSGGWLQEHFTDEYVKRARKEGRRSRAGYKLEELDRRERLLRPGLKVVDLGAAPGGFSQYAASRVGGAGLVVALDVLPMAPLPGVRFIQADFTEDAALDALLAALNGARADLVISDLAPNISGIAVSDQAKATYLAELALDFARCALKPGGAFVVKAFQGSGFPELNQGIKANFERVAARKPRASRPRSPEIYLVGQGFRGAGFAAGGPS